MAIVVGGAPGMTTQERFRRAQSRRSYPAEWDALLRDPERLVSLHRYYDREMLGLYSNTPLIGVISQDDRDEMLRLLRAFRDTGH